MEYIFVYFGSIIFFLLTLFALKIIFPIIVRNLCCSRFSERFEKMPENEQVRRAANMTSNIHHILVAVIVIVCFSTSKCEDSDDSLSWFKSDVCMLQFERKYMDSCLVTIGYLTYDLIVIKYIIKWKEDALSNQMYFHHYMAIIGALIGLTGGYSLPAVGCLI